MMRETWIPVRVARRWQETKEIAALELVAEGAAKLPAFEADAHVDVEVAPGLVRQYSLCNDPADRDRYVIGVLRAPDSRGGSAAVHQRLNQGDVIRIGAPRNLFALAKDAPHHVLLAGGIGVTPVMAMAHDLAVRQASFTLHYCARTRAQAAFLEVLGSPALAARATLHFDDEHGQERFDSRRCLSDQPAGAHVYVCGPTGFRQAAVDAARSLGWPDTHVHREVFSQAVTDIDGADRPFELELARSRRVVVVSGDSTALQALRAAGVELPSSCESGVCGTCLTTVLQGSPDHRDSYLTPAEQAAGDCFLPCCSRAFGARLTVDL